MAMGIRSVWSNTVSVIEAATPDTQYGSSLAFRHVPAYDPDDPKDARDPTRIFGLLPTGRRELTGHQLELSEPFVVVQELEAYILYPQSSNVQETMVVILEDLDRLAYQLMRTDLYDAASTGIRRRVVSGYSIDFDDSEGGVTAVTLPIEVEYCPSL